MYGTPRATREVRESDSKGRHTTTHRELIRIPGGGLVIDTPGIRSFGLGHVELSRFIHAFPDLEAGAEECPRGCTHDDEHCALDQFVAEGGADSARLQSFRRLLASRASESG